MSKNEQIVVYIDSRGDQWQRLRSNHYGTILGRYVELKRFTALGREYSFVRFDCPKFDAPWQWMEQCMLVGDGFVKSTLLYNETTSGQTAHTVSMGPGCGALFEKVEIPEIAE